MRLRPNNPIAEFVSPASGDRAPTGRRRSTDFPKFFTVAEIAEFLAVPSKTVRRWIDRELLAKHEFGSAVRISEVDLRTFIAMHRKS